MTSVASPQPTGTWDYMAPKALAGNGLRKGSDVFSLGLVIFFVCTNGGHALGGKRERTNNLMKIKYTRSADHLRPRLVGAGAEARWLMAACLELCVES